MKYILLLCVLIGVSCTTTKERLFYNSPYVVIPPATMYEKGKTLGTYVITIKDNSGYLLIEGKDKRLKYLYHIVLIGDTLTNGQINLINSK